MDELLAFSIAWMENIIKSTPRDEQSERIQKLHDCAVYTLNVLKNQNVIHCKDCKHYRFYGLDSDTVSECTIDHVENPDEDWFCADGELE